MDHQRDTTGPTILPQQSTEHCEVTVDSTEHLNELNRRAGWEAEYRQLTPDRFSGRFQTRESADLLAAKEVYNTRIEVECAPPANMVAVLVSFPGERTAEANGQSLGDHGVLVVWPGGDTRILFFRPDGGHIVHFNASAFTESCRQLNPGAARLPEKGAQVYRSPPDQVRHLRTFMNHLVLSPVGRFGSAEQVDALRKKILEAMLSDDGGSGSRAQPHPATRRRVAARARDYIEAHYDEPVTTQMLCRHTAASARTLQRAFIEHFEMTPSHYLKLRRLNAVHSELVRTDDEGARIAEIAMKHGFNHLGRFSADYGTLFREPPRATIRRKTFVRGRTA